MSYVVGQDPMFTQFYAAPLYVNPGYAGATHKSRAMFNNRYQWVKLQKPFVTYALGVDHNFKKAKSGIGLLMTYDKAGAGGLSATDIALQYAYRIDFKNGWHARPGLHFGFVTKTIDYDKLLFGDQIDRNGTSETLEPLSGKVNSNFFDFSTGVVVHNDMFWFGYSAHHLNTPNQAIIDDANSKLNTKSMFHGGARFHLVDKMHRKKYGDQQERSISPAFIYRSQGKYDQFDFGAYYIHEPFQVGLWYRGIPGLKQNGYRYPNHDSFAVLLGYRSKYFNCGYSYDFTLSSLQVNNSAGSHEISLSIVFDTSSPYKHKDKVTKREMVIPCPDF